MLPPSHTDNPDKPTEQTLQRRRLLIDIAAGAGLILAIALVFGLDRGKESADDAARRTGGLEIVVDDGEGPGPELNSQPLRLAVTPPEYDDMGKLLDTFGAGYRYTEIDFDDLLEVDRLKRYDVVFLTCGGVPRHWLGKRRLREGDRGGAGVFRARSDIVLRLKIALRRYVDGGGTLYASDWQFGMIAIAFPEFVDKSRVARGAVQKVKAKVVDRQLQRSLGDSIVLQFDKPSWCPAALDGPEVATLLTGKYDTVRGDRVTGPLLVDIPFGDGTIIFTSFHNEKQNSKTETELLRYLVFASVTAGVEADVKRTMVKGGFSPVDRNLLSTSSGDRSIAHTYRCSGGADLQFVLGFRGPGAKLKLTVAGPDGRKFEEADSSTITISAPNPAPGDWKYTVTPLEVPYKNFPFTLTVGEKK